MPRFTPKNVDGPEPVHDLANWPTWAVERLREALRAGAEPPTFVQPSPWGYYGLMCKVFDDPELAERVFVNVKACRVEWLDPQAVDDDPEAA